MHGCSISWLQSHLHRDIDNSGVGFGWFEAAGALHFTAGAARAHLLSPDRMGRYPIRAVFWFFCTCLHAIDWRWRGCCGQAHVRLCMWALACCTCVHVVIAAIVRHESHQFHHVYICMHAPPGGEPVHRPGGAAYRTWHDGCIHHDFACTSVWHLASCMIVRFVSGDTSPHPHARSCITCRVLVATCPHPHAPQVQSRLQP